jgi:hypothetical protein
VTPTCVLNLKCTFGDASRFNPGGSASRCACCQPCRARCLVHRGTDQCAIDPAATDQSKLGGQDSWTARWQKRTRREAFDRNDWFGGGIRRGPQSGCGQGSRIAGKQERSSSQVTLQLSPDLEVGGACAQQGGAGRRRSGLECCVTTPTRVRRGVQRHERTAGTIRCFAMGKSCFRGVSHASGRSLSARSSVALKKAPPKRGFNCPHACRRHSPHPDNVEPGLRFDELDRILRQEACSLEAGRRSLALTLMAAPSFGDLTTATIMAPIAKPLRSTSVGQRASKMIRVAAMTPPWEACRWRTPSRPP